MKAFIVKLHQILDDFNVTNWLGVVLFSVLILRVPSFFEPYYYGDEMIYMSLGHGVRQGLELYSQVYDNKPPLLYLVAAISGNLFWFKAILAGVNILSIVAFWNLTKNLLGKFSKIATVVFAILTTIPLLEGNIVNAELFMILFSIISFGLLLKEKVLDKDIFLAGIFFGIAALFKIPSAFEVPVIVFYWLITKSYTNFGELIKKSIVLILGFTIPILLTFAWFFIQGNLMEYIKAAFLQNVGYVSSFRPGDVQKPFLVKNLPLIIRGLLVLLGSGVLFVFKKKLSTKFIFISLWTLFGLFAVTLSERPYPHYLIQVVAPISLLVAMLIAEKTIEQVLAIIPLAVITFVPFYYHFYHYSSLNYYANFVKFASGQIGKEEYFRYFAPSVNFNYEIASFIESSTRPTDKVFVWNNDSPTIYSLSRRLPPIKYTADYHIIDYSNKKELIEALTNSKPKIIVTTSNFPLPELSPLLTSNYLMIKSVGNSEIWSRISVNERD